MADGIAARSHLFLPPLSAKTLAASEDGCGLFLALPLRCLRALNNSLLPPWQNKTLATYSVLLLLHTARCIFSVTITCNSAC